jgi:hypothetical protein
MEFFQLKVTLRDIKPPIWRRILVSPEISLDRLHDILQIAMGWTNSHLHQFETPEGFFSDPMFELEETGNSKKMKLAQVLDRPKASIRYEYDFGDGWEHQILLEKAVDLESNPAAICVAGARACPPEDCGGIWGYENLIEILQDPKHPEHKEMAEWVGGKFDPEFLDLEAINAKLIRLTAPKPKKSTAKKSTAKKSAAKKSASKSASKQ